MTAANFRYSLALPAIPWIEPGLVLLKRTKHADTHDPILSG